MLLIIYPSLIRNILTSYLYIHVRQRTICIHINSLMYPHVLLLTLILHFLVFMLFLFSSLSLNENEYKYIYFDLVYNKIYNNDGDI